MPQCGWCQTFTVPHSHCTEAWDTTTWHEQVCAYPEFTLSKMDAHNFRLEVSADPAATCFHSCRQECETRVSVGSSFQKTVLK